MHTYAYVYVLYTCIYTYIFMSIHMYKCIPVFSQGLWKTELRYIFHLNYKRYKHASIYTYININEYTCMWALFQWKPIPSYTYIYCVIIDINGGETLLAKSQRTYFTWMDMHVVIRYSYMVYKGL
jgi:hypothetical protein